MTLLLSKKSWLITVLRSSNLLLQNQSAFIADRQFATTQQLCRIKVPKRPPRGDTPSPSKVELSESQLNANRIFLSKKHCGILHCPKGNPQANLRPANRPGIRPNLRIGPRIEFQPIAGRKKNFCRVCGKVFGRLWIKYWLWLLELLLAA